MQGGVGWIQILWAVPALAKALVEPMATAAVTLEHNAVLMFNDFVLTVEPLLANTPE